MGSLIELAFESKTEYADPFNDVDIDVIFSRDNRSWRVPAFWRGGLRWSVRFAPYVAGIYDFHVVASDTRNIELNSQQGRIAIEEYAGASGLCRRGPLKLSENGRYFEHADGTPFFWLGDTWWMGLSDRLCWEGFQRLAADRKSKGFSVVQIVAGLVPLETCPTEPGCCNEGGGVWEPDFKRINPAYFDFADGRIAHLVESEIVPLIVGGWRLTLSQMGVHRMKQHWRYLIARYGAYPVLWSVGGEVFDPPAYIADQLAEPWRSTVVVRGWTDVARYVREIDPYHHPITAHELPPPLDIPLEDRSITDFDLLQGGQFGWPSLALSVAQLNSRYSRADIERPVVQGEIGYENHYSRHFDVYQRAAFWISMLNGAAGHTYGADATWGAYSNAKGLPSSPLSFLNWEQGMQLPGSYQVGLGAKLLRRYEWWRLVPHPEWVAPRGRTFFDSHHEFALDSWKSWWLETSWWLEKKFDQGFSHLETKFPGESWVERYGSVDRPYAAGIARELRVIYVPVRRDSPLPEATPPTVLGLECGVRYHAYLWEPALGIRFDLGSVERPPMGEIIFEDRFCDAERKAWSCYARRPFMPHERTQEGDDVLSIVEGIAESNLVAEVEIKGQSRAGLIVRHQSEGTYVVAIYSADDNVLYLQECSNHVGSPRLGMTSVPKVGGTIRLSLEVRENMAAASLSDGERSFTTPIVQLTSASSGHAGFLHPGNIQSKGHACERFSLRRSPCLREDESLPAKLYDAAGHFRGELDSWRTQGKSKHIILDAYRPAKLPGPGDWILVLDATRTNKSVCPA